MITVIAVGKLKEKAYKDLVDEYVKRLSAYTKVEIIEVADETNQLEDTKVKKL
ncbi:MAG: 23S rRNA (pseudouridine(1915)-N(3))-methyltransferase RlmH, partial [Erysipelotrichaceae bacterium]|nr:23S rRNA (pseudouridine(1915)-N(3))-methyltransferase RlmH [Erysipelotrichaceae bacterium]